MRQAPSTTNQHQGEDGDPCPFMPVVEPQFLRRELEVAHVKADRERDQNHGGDQPVQGHGHRGIAVGLYHGFMRIAVAVELLPAHCDQRHRAMVQKGR